ncbi:MAG: hypothetical protein II574_02035 [Ruminococcus sp.]|nr:hypothetical protein [Ruminococcus sp.]
MVILIGAAAFFGMLFLLGVEIMTILTIFQIILAALTGLCLLFFIFCAVMLLLSKKHPAKLIEIVKDKKKDDDEPQADKMLSTFAFYEVDGERVRNWFPAERLMSRKIYESKECFVRIAKLGSKRLVFDRHSVVIVITGTILMGLCTAGFSVFLLAGLVFG